jgi:hypothetical protein
MNTITWVPGENYELDNLYNDLREKQYADHGQRLWKNYSNEFIKDVIALTIHFDDHGNPEMCSSVASRNCWPKSVYRILNRLWKNSNKIHYPVKMSPSFGMSAKSQIEWLNKNTDCQLYFISRQTPNWERWCIRQFQKQFDLTFVEGKNKYLTCPDICDETCWQTIIYNGDPTLLDYWKNR